MDNSERQLLDKMIKESDFVDNTSLIRNTQHSELIKNDVNRLLKLKQEYNNINNLDIYKKMAQIECSFLYKNYKGIFDRLVNDKLELNVMLLLIKTLRKIEDGAIDQNEGSVEVGKILKQIYIDKVIVEEKQDNSHENTLSWNTYKNMIN
tara:strand:+ start:395 stop:844 length:450 start_codon:yes stop_codon:yes gene_type:complete